MQCSKGILTLRVRATRSAGQLAQTGAELGAWRIWFARRREHLRPREPVTAATRETLGIFADRSMNAIECIGCLALKHHRGAHRALVNTVEDRLERRRTPIERQFAHGRIQEADLR